jgi:hypothetical protein
MGIILFLMSGALLSCGGSGSAKITDEFVEILGEPASEQNVEKADDFLRTNLTRLSREQAGEMLLLWEEYALNYDNSLVDYERIIA